MSQKCSLSAWGISVTDASKAKLYSALVLDPIYALAHAFAAICYHCLFLHAGLHEENRAAPVGVGFGGAHLLLGMGRSDLDFAEPPP